MTTLHRADTCTLYRGDAHFDAELEQAVGRRVAACVAAAQRAWAGTSGGGGRPSASSYVILGCKHPVAEAFCALPTFSAHATKWKDPGELIFPAEITAVACIPTDVPGHSLVVMPTGYADAARILALALGEGGSPGTPAALTHLCLRLGEHHAAAAWGWMAAAATALTGGAAPPSSLVDPTTNRGAAHCRGLPRLLRVASLLLLRPPHRAPCSPEALARAAAEQAMNPRSPLSRVVRAFLLLPGQQGHVPTDAGWLTLYQLVERVREVAPWAFASKYGPFPPSATAETRLWALLQGRAERLSREAMLDVYEVLLGHPSRAGYEVCPKDACAALLALLPPSPDPGGEPKACGRPRRGRPRKPSTRWPRRRGSRASQPTTFRIPFLASVPGDLGDVRLPHEVCATEDEWAATVLPTMAVVEVVSSSRDASSDGEEEEEQQVRSTSSETKSTSAWSTSTASTGSTGSTEGIPSPPFLDRDDWCSLAARGFKRKRAREPTTRWIGSGGVSPRKRSQPTPPPPPPSAPTLGRTCRAAPWTVPGQGPRQSRTQPRRCSLERCGG